MYTFLVGCCTTRIAITTINMTGKINTLHKMLYRFFFEYYSTHTQCHNTVTFIAAYINYQ